jgi:hypothetical protein
MTLEELVRRRLGEVTGAGLIQQIPRPEVGWHALVVRNGDKLVHNAPRLTHAERLGLPPQVLLVQSLKQRHRPRRNPTAEARKWWRWRRSPLGGNRPPQPMPQPMSACSRSSRAVGGSGSTLISFMAAARTSGRWSGIAAQATVTQSRAAPVGGSHRGSGRTRLQVARGRRGASLQSASLEDDVLRRIQAAGDVAQLILTFGPHAGEAVGQVAVADPDYLRRLLARSVSRPRPRAPFRR